MTEEELTLLPLSAARTADTVPAFLGCLRRWYWTGAAWRSDSGNAILLLAGGRREAFSWRGSHVDLFWHPEQAHTLLMWRPGPWRDRWVGEVSLLCGMVRAGSNTCADGVLLFHEVDGRTVERYVGCPTDAEKQFRELDASWAQSLDRGVPLRWSRAETGTDRVCQRCVVRRRCESLDLESGETKDWLRGDSR